MKAKVDDNDYTDDFEISDGDNMKTMLDDNVGDNVETSVLGEVGQRAPLGALTASTIGSNQHTVLVLCLYNTTWLHSLPVLLLVNNALLPVLVLCLLVLCLYYTIQPGCTHCWYY